VPEPDVLGTERTISARLSDSKTDDNPRARYGKIQFPIMNINRAYSHLLRVGTMPTWTIRALLSNLRKLPDAPSFRRNQTDCSTLRDILLPAGRAGTN